MKDTWGTVGSGMESPREKKKMLRKTFAAIAALAVLGLANLVPTGQAKAQDFNQILTIVNQAARAAQQAQGRNGYNHGAGYGQRAQFAPPPRRQPDAYGYGYGAPDSYGSAYQRPQQYRADGYDAYRPQPRQAYASGNLSSDPRHNCWKETRMRPDRHTGRMVEKLVVSCENN